MAGIDNNTLLYLRGDSFKDLSPNNTTVTNNGVTVVDNMLNFDGVNDLLSVPNNIDFDNDFTIEFYFHKSSSTYGYYKTILGNSPSNAVQGITLFVENDNALGCEFGFTTGKYQFRTSTTAFNTSLTHIAFVKNGSNYAFFVNGVKIATYSNSNSIIKNSLPFTFGKNRDNSTYLNMKLYNVRFSNIARYTENFTPSTQPYNSITINKTNQTDTNIKFNIEKLGQETINKVEVLVNGTVSKTYTDSYDNIDYLIDKSLCAIGNNNITIRVTFDDVYTEELLLSYTYAADKLPLETPLLDTVERVKLLTKIKQSEKNMLSSILASKNVEVSEEDKMSDLIGKVDLLGEYDDGKLWLYKDGDECVNVTGGWVDANYSDAGYSTGTLDNINNRLELRQTTYTWCASVNKLVDITEYNTLNFIVDANISSGGNVRLICGDVKFSEKNHNVESFISSSFSKKHIVLDISNVNGLKYIYFGVYLASVNAYQIWLEK